jgi:predicted nucleotidyltransferase
LLGSRIKGYGVKNSDLDMAIFVDDKKKVSLRKISSLFNKKKIDIPYEIDISIVDLSSSPLFLFQIIKDGQCIYSKSPLGKTELELKIMHIFYDTQHIRNIYHQYLSQSVEKGIYGY